MFQMTDQTNIFSHHDEQTTNAVQFPLFEENDDDPAFDAFVHDMAREPSDYDVFGNNVTDFSGIGFDDNVHSHENQNENPNFIPDNSSTFGNPIPIPTWPILPSPYSCSCCQTLREFYHVNGDHVAKLDIHGRLGIFSHAVLQKYDISNTLNPEYHMFDFSQENLSSVKQFLIQYCKDRKQEGYTMVQDPLSYFYDALCIGLDVEDMLNAGVLPDQQASRGEDRSTNQADNVNRSGEEGNGVRQTERDIACQRERTKNMKLKDLEPYFHLPMNEASKELNICPSAIKSICRKEGLKRWPHRKIKSIETEISKQKKFLNSNDANVRAYALAEIDKLEKTLASCYEPPNIEEMIYIGQNS